MNIFENVQIMGEKRTYIQILKYLEISLLKRLEMLFNPNIIPFI